MLIRLTAPDISAFTEGCAYEHVFGSRALTALRAYGLGDGRARFYLCRKGHETAAALYLDTVNRVLTISADERADPLPIAELIKQEGIREVDTNWGLCESLRRILGGTIESSYYMVYRRPKDVSSYPDIHTGDLAAVFDILQRSHEYYRTHLRFDTWAAELNHKLSRGLAELYQIEKDGQSVGTGCIVSEDGECGVIAAVAVVPEYRRQGLGSRLSRFLVQRIQQKGKTPRLIAGYDEVAELYRQIGFATCGRWGELYL